MPSLSVQITLLVYSDYTIVFYPYKHLTTRKETFDNYCQGFEFLHDHVLEVHSKILSDNPSIYKE